jgi:hypothetical protein
MATARVATIPCGQCSCKVLPLDAADAELIHVAAAEVV